MPVVELPELSDDVVFVSDALRSGLERILGDAFASLFLYGAVAFPRPEHWHLDFDFHVLLRRRLTDRERRDIGALYAALAEGSKLGGDLDGYFVLLTDAARSDPPRHQLNLHVRDDAWALHRAHVHAGRYYVIRGVDPIEVVPKPTWPEVATALRAEMRFVDRHPEAPAFGILNACRILAGFETHDVVMSKYQAAEWALASLPAEWHDTISAASRWYAQLAADDDARAIETNRAAFVEYVNRSLPPQ